MSLLRLIAYNFQAHHFLNEIYPRLLIFEIASFVKSIAMKIALSHNRYIKISLLS